MANDNPDSRALFDDRIRDLFRDAVLISWRDPRRLLRLFRLFLAQRRAVRSRRAWQSRGLSVPPLVIASITRRCNLRCRGCYSLARPETADPELEPTRWAEIFGEAAGLGVSFIMLAGGEPFTRPEVIDLAERFPQVIFPVFTNGLLLDEPKVGNLRRRPNLIPVVSLEGPSPETDSRRGAGVYDRCRDLLARLRRKGIFYGVSVTLTRRNFQAATSAHFLRTVTRSGGRLVFFIEYTPLEPGTENLVLSAPQRDRLKRLPAELAAEHRALFIAFPGDEEPYGGCLAAGRGFIHISASGRLEPCPFAPFSDTSLRDSTLREALASPLLGAIREAHAELVETRGGCALWNKRDWVRRLTAVPQRLDGPATIAPPPASYGVNGSLDEQGGFDVHPLS